MIAKMDPGVENTNPYDSESPEWQLWENMVASDRESRAFASDASRYTRLAQTARERAQKYRQALAKLQSTLAPERPGLGDGKS